MLIAVLLVELSTGAIVGDNVGWKFSVDEMLEDFDDDFPGCTETTVAATTTITTNTATNKYNFCLFGDMEWADG